MVGLPRISGGWHCRMRSGSGATAGLSSSVRAVKDVTRRVACSPVTIMPEMRVPCPTLAVGMRIGDESRSLAGISRTGRSHPTCPPRFASWAWHPARNYQPTTGRWMSADPLLFVDGANLYVALLCATQCGFLRILQGR